MKNNNNFNISIILYLLFIIVLIVLMNFLYKILPTVFPDLIYRSPIPDNVLIAMVTAQISFASTLCTFSYCTILGQLILLFKFLLGNKANTSFFDNIVIDTTVNTLFYYLLIIGSILNIYLSLKSISFTIDYIDYISYVPISEKPINFEKLIELKNVFINSFLYSMRWNIIYILIYISINISSQTFSKDREQL